MFMKISECLLFAEIKLKDSGIESYEYDARELMSYCLSISKFDLIFKKNQELSNEDYTKYNTLIDLRSKRIPLQHITHHSDFYGLDLYVDKNVLIPRFETEVLCEEAIKEISNNPMTVLDLCTGSGCIAISIAKNCPNAKVYAIDISEKALEVAKNNALRNKVDITFIQNDLLNNININFDIIISNPPYINKSDMLNLQEEVKHDPDLALYGGEDGMDLIRKIIFSNNIKNGTKLMLEIGHNQSEKLEVLMNPHYKKIRIIKDYCDVNRFIIAEKGV